MPSGNGPYVTFESDAVLNCSHLLAEAHMYDVYIVQISATQHCEIHILFIQRCSGSVSALLCAPFRCIFLAILFLPTAKRPRNLVHTHRWVRGALHAVLFLVDPASALASLMPS